MGWDAGRRHCPDDVCHWFLGEGIHAMSAGTGAVFSSSWDLDKEMNTHFMPGVQVDSVCACFSWLHHSSSS